MTKLKDHSDVPHQNLHHGCGTYWYVCLRYARISTSWHYPNLNVDTTKELAVDRKCTKALSSNSRSLRYLISKTYKTPGKKQWTVRSEQWCEERTMVRAFRISCDSVGYSFLTRSTTAGRTYNGSCVGDDACFAKKVFRFVYFLIDCFVKWRNWLLWKSVYLHNFWWDW